MSKTSILISNVTLFTDPDTASADRQWLLCKDDIIHSFGSMETLPKSQDSILIDGTDKLLMPGLINAHNHCAMTLFRGLADDLELGTWLNEHIFPAEAAHVNREMVYWCTKLAAAEMILSGTTTVADGYFHEDQAAQAFLESGIRAIPAQGIVDFPAPGVTDPTANIAAVETFLAEWKEKDDTITPAVFAHSPYTCCPRTLRAAKALAARYHVPFFIHIAESKIEPDIIMDPRGASPIRHLAALDLLDKDTVLIHCVWVDEADRKIILESGAGVIICPQSHLKLASGIAGAAAMDAMGIPIGLGTDGSASNNSLDLFREMDILAKTQKLQTLDATAMTARQALSAATVNNAQILGLPKVGRIAPGYKADIILLDTKQPHRQPFYNGDSLVYSGGGADVETVIINGKTILKDRKLLSFDLNECMTEVRKLAAPLGVL